MRLMTVKPPSRRSPAPATLGSTVASGSGVVSSSSTPIEVVKKALDRVVAGEHVRAGGELDEFLLPCAAAVHHVRQAQALADAQLLGQIEHRLGGWLAAEELVGDAAEREHVEARAMRGVGAGGLGREVDRGPGLRHSPRRAGCRSCGVPCPATPSRRRCATRSASSSDAGAASPLPMPWTRMLCGPRARWYRRFEWAYFSVSAMSRTSCRRCVIDEVACRCHAAGGPAAWPWGRDRRSGPGRVRSPCSP